MRYASLILLIMLLCPLPAFAEATPESVLDSLPTETLEALYDSGLSQGEPFRETVLKIARGEIVVSAEQLLKLLSSHLMSALYDSLSRLPVLIIPAVLCGAAGVLREESGKTSVGQILYVACYLLIAGLLIKDLSGYMNLIRQAVSQMAGAMQALFPLLLTLLAAVGSSATAFFGPAVVAGSGTMTTVIEQVTLRCALIAALLTILSGLSKNMRISRLTRLFRSIGNWTLGISFTVFIGVTALQGMGAATADGVTLRTAKYAVDNFVPVVGGMFADTMDTLVGCSLLIKNALGITGMLVLFSLSMSPIIQAVAGVMLYRGAAALLEPVGDQRLVTLIHEFSEALMLLFVVLLSVFAMFILLTAQLLAVGNMTVGFL